MRKKPKSNGRPAIGRSGAGDTRNASRRDVFARIRRAVVAIAKAPAIRPGMGFDPKQIVIAGSGFFAEQDGLVVTAGHVVDPWIAALQQAKTTGPPAEMPAALFHGPSEVDGNQMSWGYFLVPITGIFRPQNFDLAVLTTNPVGAAAEAIQTVAFADAPCAEGDHVATCGYPFGMELHQQILNGLPAIIPSFSQGVVSAVLPHHLAPPAAMQRFQIHAMISAGNSGGPVFDPYSGRVVGVITNTLTANYQGVLTRQIPKDKKTGAPLGAPVESTIDLGLAIGLALAEHVHHVRTVIAEAKGAKAKQGGP